MKSLILTSDGFSYKAIEALKLRVDNLFGDADLLLFTLYPEYDLESVAGEIAQIFGRDDFIVFHAIEHFNGTSVVKNGISVCCIKFQKNASLHSFYVDDIKEEATLQKSADYFNGNQNKFHIIFAGVCNGDMGSFIESLSEKLNYTPLNNIVGGVSSGLEKDGVVQAFQYIDKHLIKNGFVVLSFENMEAVVDASLGFQPYGITYKVTKAEGNRLYSVDDGKKYSYIASKMLLATEENADIRSLWYAPLSILSENDGYMMTLRTVKKITDEYVEFFAPIKEGEYFKLSFATPEDLVKTDAETAKRVLQKIPKPELSLNFSCIARQYVLEDMQEEELKMYVRNFQTALFGFFTFGEIGPDKMYKKLKFYNETSLAVLMREK